MPVYVNRIFNNGTESEKKCFHYCLLKNANAEDESQGVFTMMGTESPKYFSLCESEPGFQVDLRNKPWLLFSLKRSEYNVKNHKGFSDSVASWLCIYSKLHFKRKKVVVKIYLPSGSPFQNRGQNINTLASIITTWQLLHSCRMTITTSGTTKSSLKTIWRLFIEELNKEGKDY